MAAREFIDFWIENSVHAREQTGATGASQDVIELARRCVDMAKTEGISSGYYTGGLMGSSSIL